jgi:predicted adenine nucleotide alpha hydrolase (AANH) superfamily ATPase
MVGPSLLLHCCCAHCAAYTVHYWRRQGYSVRGYWYNPNIQPYTEHQARLEAMKSLAEQLELPLVIADGYDIYEYFRRVAGDEAGRCRHCFRLRLLTTAATAREMGLSAFSTSLLISPHQQHDLLGSVGWELAGETGLDFIYADLRKRYSESRRITKNRQLYSQQYCGCLYSEGERHKAMQIE